MIYCSKCMKEINKPTYLVRQLGYLCGKCARIDSAQRVLNIRKQIINLQNEINSLEIESEQAFINDCL